MCDPLVPVTASLSGGLALAARVGPLLKVGPAGSLVQTELWMALRGPLS